MRHKPSRSGPRRLRRHVRRWYAGLLAVVVAAGVLTALGGVTADTASGAQRIAYGGSSTWTWSWETTSFAVSGPGVVDIWTTCRPISETVRQHELLVGTRNASWLKRFNVPCDRRGHWLRRVGIPRNTTLTVFAHPFRTNGLFCYPPARCATGWTSVYTSS
jgi:hypothetical protein